MRLSFASTVLVSSLLVPVIVTADGLDADYVGETLQIFETTGDANQGVAVDDKYIYAVTNRRITKMDKETGEVSHTMISVVGIETVSNKGDVFSSLTPIDAFAMGRRRGLSRWPL